MDFFLFLHGMGLMIGSSFTILCIAWVRCRDDLGGFVFCVRILFSFVHDSLTQYYVLTVYRTSLRTTWSKRRGFFVFFWWLLFFGTDLGVFFCGWRFLLFLIIVLYSVGVRVWLRSSAQWVFVICVLVAGCQHVALWNVIEDRVWSYLGYSYFCTSANNLTFKEKN